MALKSSRQTNDLHATESGQQSSQWQMCISHRFRLEFDPNDTVSYDKQLFFAILSKYTHGFRLHSGGSSSSLLCYAVTASTNASTQPWIQASKPSRVYFGFYNTVTCNFRLLVEERIVVITGEMKWPPKNSVAVASINIGTH